ncbi:hypothetical protein F5Y11DRAFT_349840 [Daldinia sp. FL1419]|nr:hypothetical protein F5Y11DRAFT_349840 [Daldinia sp. FL1419]
MCCQVTLEICCEDEASSSLPTCLGSPRFIVLCGAARAVQGSQELKNNSSPNSPKPMSIARACPSFDGLYIRFERVFFTRCKQCVVNKGPQKYGLNINDIPIVFKYDELLLHHLTEATYNTPYQELVLKLAEDYGIHQRWMLLRGGWVKAPKPTPEDPLGPNPPYV